MGGDHAIGPLHVELREYSFCYGSANSRFGTSTKLINQQQGMFVGISYEMLHIAQVR